MLNVKMKISDGMSANNEETDENKLIRVPQKLRKCMCLKVGDILKFDTYNKDSIELMIGKVLLNDIESDDSICYVTQKTFKVINIEDSLKQKIDPTVGITLGCDPELFIINSNNNRLICAYTFLDRWGTVGHDGILAEFRPPPSICENILTDEIWGLINKLREKISMSDKYDPNIVKLVGASSMENSTAGFHLHYGIPQMILGKTPDKVRLMQQVVRGMDYYVGIPSIILEGAVDSKRRSNMAVTYGKPGDFRIDNRTFEYRVPGGYMLRHPILTRGLIALGAVVMEDLVYKIKVATNNYIQLYWAQTDNRLNDMYPNLLSTKQIRNLVCNPSVNNAKQHIQRIFNDVSKMTGFEKRSKAIIELFTVIDNNTTFSSDIEQNWGNCYYE